MVKILKEVLKRHTVLYVCIFYVSFLVSVSFFSYEFITTEINMKMKNRSMEEVRQTMLYRSKKWHEEKDRVRIDLQNKLLKYSAE